MISMNKMLTKMYLDQLKRNYSNPIQVIEKSSSLRGLANVLTETSKIINASNKQGEVSGTNTVAEESKELLASELLGSMNDLIEMCFVKDSVPIPRKITVDKGNDKSKLSCDDGADHPFQLDETDYLFFKVENLKLDYGDDDDAKEGGKLIIVDLQC